MSKVPQMVRVYEPARGRNIIYATMAEIYNWAVSITNSTQEGERYHDALSIYNEAIAAIAAFFDGSKGTYTDIMTGETRSYPVICDTSDITGILLDDYNVRLVYWPLFTSTYPYTDDNDDRWYAVLKHWADRVKRFCKFNNIRYTKLIQTMMLEYNPIADYWTKEKEVNAKAPYITIANNKSSQTDYAMDPMVADWNQVAGSVDGQLNPMDQAGHNAYKTSTTNQTDDEFKNEHYTTTYDSAATNRLEGYDVQTGGTKIDHEQIMPTSGDFRKREEEGNKGSQSPQDMVLKEYDIAELWNIVKLFMNDLSKEVFLQLYWTP